MRKRRTRLVIVVILTVVLYLSLRWVAFTFEAEIEGMMVRIEYQRVEKGILTQLSSSRHNWLHTLSQVHHR